AALGLAAPRAARDAVLPAALGARRRHEGEGFHTALRSSLTSPSKIWSAAYRLAAATWCGSRGLTALVATSRVPWSAVCRYSITRSAMSEQSMADSTNSGSRSSAPLAYSDHRPLRRQ